MIVVHNLTSGFLQTKHLRNGEQWKFIDTVKNKKTLRLW